VCANPSYGLFVGIALCLVMEIFNMNRDERRANVAEGLEIYITNTRAEMEEVAAKDAAADAKKTAKAGK